MIVRRDADLFAIGGRAGSCNAGYENPANGRLAGAGEGGLATALGLARQN